MSKYSKKHSMILEQVNERVSGGIYANDGPGSLRCHDDAHIKKTKERLIQQREQRGEKELPSCVRMAAEDCQRRGKIDAS
jgi:hypothetical protein